MASKTGGNGASKSATKTKAATTTTAEAPARAKPVPARVLANVAALGEPHRLAVLGYVAASAAPVTMADVEQFLGISTEAASLVVNYLKQRGWLASERIAKGAGGPGWKYRLSDTGRERLMAIGG